MSIFFRKHRQSIIGRMPSDSLMKMKSNCCPEHLETCYRCHRASIHHFKMIALKTRKHPNLAEDVDMKTDLILKLRYPKNLTGLRIEFITEVNSYLSLWKDVGSSA